MDGTYGMQILDGMYGMHGMVSMISRYVISMHGMYEYMYSCIYVCAYSYLSMYVIPCILALRSRQVFHSIMTSDIVVQRSWRW